MFASGPFWALTAANFANLWGFFLLMTEGPTYISEVLGFALSQSGALASLPYILKFICAFFFGAIGDSLVQHNLLSTTAIRKYFTIFCT